MPCDLEDLKEAATCFMNKCMGDSTRESINLYIAIAFLKASGGTDYTNSLSTLEIDSKSWERLAVSDREAITTYINLQFAVANGSDFPGGTSTSNLKSLSRCIQCLGSEQRKSIAAFIWCQIADIFAFCPPLSGAGSPVGVITPQCVGQTYTDIITNHRYRSTGIISVDWELLSDVTVIGGEGDGGVIIGGEGGGDIEIGAE